MLTLPKSGVRKLHIDGVEYLYTIQRSSVIFYLESGKVVATYPEVTGRDWSTIERGQWKKTTDGMVRPSDCKRFLERYLRGV